MDKVWSMQKGSITIKPLNLSNGSSCKHRYDICQKFTLPDFQAKNFTPQKCVICKIFHARYKSVNAFDISNFGIFVRIELNFTVFKKKYTN